MLLGGLIVAAVRMVRRGIPTVRSPVADPLRNTGAGAAKTLRRRRGGFDLRDGRPSLGRASGQSSFGANTPVIRHTQLGHHIRSRLELDRWRGGHHPAAAAWPGRPTSAQRLLPGLAADQLLGYASACLSPPVSVPMAGSGAAREADCVIGNQGASTCPCVRAAAPATDHLGTARP